MLKFIFRCQDMSFGDSICIKEEINIDRDKYETNEVGIKNELNIEYDPHDLHEAELNANESGLLLPDNYLNLRIEKVEHSGDVAKLENDGFSVKQELEREFEKQDSLNEDLEVVISDSCLVKDEYFADRDEINIRPKVVKIHKAVFSDEKVLIELNGAEDSKEVIISDSLDDDVELNVGDLLAPLEHRCSVCHKQYRYLKSLQRHESAHELPKNESSNNDEGESGEVDGSYACFCGKVYRRRSSVTSCLKSHESAGLTCKWCSKVFDRKVDMKLHICPIRKTIKSKFRCNKCTKTFRFQSNLIKHKRMHIINIEVKQKEDKKINKYFQCKECGINFLKKSLYENHIENHKIKHEELKKETKFMFKCNKCGKDCSTLKAFTKHKLKHEKKV